MNQLFLMYLVFGVLQIVLALPLLFGKIRPNGWYGFRVPSTLRNADLWYDVNRYAARWLLGSGFIFTVVVVALLLVPGMTVDQYALICGGVFMASITVSLIFSFAYLNRQKRRLKE